jgi:hypothetical protein
MSTLSTLDEKYGLVADAAVVSGLVAGIALVSIPVIQAMCVVTALVAGPQLALRLKEARQ